MKNWLLILIAMPTLVLAQDNTGMSPEMMEMMEQAQKAQACMQEIDLSQFDEIEKEGKAMQTEIKALCMNGDRDEAQEKALEYSREMMNKPAFKDMQKCSEMLRGVLPKMPFDNFEEEFKNRHVCDEMSS